jgi:hypothetical protein
MKRTPFLIGMLLVVTAMLAGPSPAAVFSCDDVGLDAAIAASQAGDSGPHSLNCSPGDIILVDSVPPQRPLQLTLTADLTLDGRGATIECRRAGSPCSLPVFVISSPVVCRIPICIPPVFGPPSTVELRDLTFLGGASASSAAPRSLSGTPW